MRGAEGCLRGETQCGPWTRAHLPLGALVSPPEPFSKKVCLLAVCISRRLGDLNITISLSKAKQNENNTPRGVVWGHSGS